MRSNKMIALIIASAILPSLAFGIDTDPAKSEKKDEVAKVAPTPAKYLSFTEAQKAFGPEFGADKNKEGTVAFLWGVSSSACLKEFKIEPNAVKGEYSIFYSGKSEDCLDHAKQKAAATSENKLIGLSTVEEYKMKLDGSFTALNLRHEDPTSDKNRVKLDPLNDGEGKPIAHVSAKELELQKKKETEDKANAGLEDSLNFVATCGRNLTELDVMTEVVAELEGMKSVVADEKKSAKITAAKKRINDRIFAACKLQIEKGRTTDLADCGERLKKLALHDESYLGKVKDAYITLIGRYMNSTKMALDEAYQASVDVVALIKEFDLEEKEEKNLLASEKNMHFAFLRKAAMEGSESTAYAEIRQNTVEFMLEDDLADDVTCLNDEGKIIEQMKLAAACSESARMSAVLFQSEIFANGVQKAKMEKAAVELRKAQEQEVLGMCTFNTENKVSMTPADQSRCALLIARRDAEAKAAANAGISTDGHGQVVNTQNTTTPATNSTTPASQNTTDSAFLGTGYTGQKTVPATPTSNANPTVAPAQNVTVNRVPTLGRR